jgi:hypothetical protein
VYLMYSPEAANQDCQIPANKTSGNQPYNDANDNLPYYGVILAPIIGTWPSLGACEFGLSIG